jgi:hypothetical protein
MFLFYLGSADNNHHYPITGGDGHDQDTKRMTKGKAAMEKTCPDDARRVIWALGEFFH